LIALELQPTGSIDSVVGSINSDEKTFLGDSYSLCLDSAFSTAPVGVPSSSTNHNQNQLKVTKQSGLKRYLRHLFPRNTTSSSPFDGSNQSFIDAHETLREAGCGKQEQQDLYDACFSLSASEIPPFHISNAVIQNGNQISLDEQPDLIHTLELLEADETSIQQHKLLSFNELLHYAVALGRKTATKYLLERGFDPWQQNSVHMSPSTFGWYGLRHFQDDGEKYANVWRCMLLVFEKQRELRPEAI
jgi:hypothetical protein